VVVFVVLASLLLTGRLYRQYGDPYQPTPPSLERVGDYSVTVSFTIRSGPARCRIQARDGSGTEGGYAEVKADRPGPVHATLITTRRAGTVEVLGCRPA